MAQSSLCSSLLFETEVVLALEFEPEPLPLPLFAAGAVGPNLP